LPLTAIALRTTRRRGLEPERTTDWLTRERRRRRLAELQLHTGSPALCLANLAELEMWLVGGAEKRGRQSGQWRGTSIVRSIMAVDHGPPSCLETLEWPKRLDVENLTPRIAPVRDDGVIDHDATMSR